ncbi:hypothetical protein BDZ89DRAFT_1124495 [Hymenopellis radicata]|nr:hypothetical protein BDZ89DRAFT_1124495 [Hymenopellis radicata]
MKARLVPDCPLPQKIHYAVILLTFVHRLYATSLCLFLGHLPRIDPEDSHKDASNVVPSLEASPALRTRSLSRCLINHLNIHGPALPKTSPALIQRAAASSNFLPSANVAVLPSVAAQYSLLECAEDVGKSVELSVEAPSPSAGGGDELGKPLLRMDDESRPRSYFRTRTTKPTMLSQHDVPHHQRNDAMHLVATSEQIVDDVTRNPRRRWPNPQYERLKNSTALIDNHEIASPAPAPVNPPAKGGSLSGIYLSELRPSRPTADNAQAMPVHRLSRPVRAHKHHTHVLLELLSAWMQRGHRIPRRRSIVHPVDAINGNRPTTADKEAAWIDGEGMEKQDIAWGACSAAGIIEASNELRAQ